MSDDEQQDAAMIYVANEPDVKALQSAYASTIIDLDDFFQACERGYNDRRNLWPGKAQDLRKHGATAFPWDGASDMEVNTVGERIDTYVALLDQALDRSQIKAFPTNHTSMARSAVVSSFLKWMRKTYIPDFKRQMELGANNLLEKGLMISYVGWRKELRTFKMSVSLEELGQISPELVEIILSGDDQRAVDLLLQAYPATSEKRVKRAVRELRKRGFAEVSVPRESVDSPVVHACAPDGEVLFPSYCYDPQRAPYVFWRTFYTAQELEKKVTSEGWDEEWVEHAIRNLRGKDAFYYDGGSTQRYRTTRTTTEDDNDLIMVIHGYQRLIDEEDGSEGIYCTVFHPNQEGYAKHELLNGYDEYPFVVTSLGNSQKRLYDVQSFPAILRGPQMQIKTERDSRLDRASLATMPPLMHPAGRPPSDWGPGRRVPYRRLGEFAFGPIPQFDPGSERLEEQMVRQADLAVGLNLDSPLASLRQQFIVNKFLDHVRDVLSLAFKLYQRMGPEEVFFQVTGNPDPQLMTKGSAEDSFSFQVSFDTRESDPENVKAQLEAMATLRQLDVNGRMNMDKVLELMAGSINPFIADYVLQPAQEAQDRMMKDVTDDLAKLYAGIEVPARPNGAQFAMQMVQSYVQQPDVAQRLQQDEAFAGRLQKYAQAYQFAMTQDQNAVIGRLGVAPAQMGEVQTQGMEQ